MSLKYIEVTEHLRASARVQKRDLNGCLKQMNKTAMETWKAKYLPLHFMRPAYARYPGAFSRRKRFGAPLVESGHLKEVMTGREHPIRATNKGAEIVIRYGRPGKWTKEKIEKAILRVMIEEHLSFKQAQKKVYTQQAVYSRKTMEVIRRGVDVENEQEQRQIGKVMEESFHAEVVRRVEVRKFRV